MTDPVQILCGEFYDVWDDDDRERVRDVLSKVRQDGWRLVRSDTCANPKASMIECGCRETRITEEWTG